MPRVYEHPHGVIAESDSGEMDILLAAEIRDGRSDKLAVASAFDLGGQGPSVNEALRSLRSIMTNYLYGLRGQLGIALESPWKSTESVSDETVINMQDALRNRAMHTIHFSVPGA